MYKDIICSIVWNNDNLKQAKNVSVYDWLGKMAFKNRLTAIITYKSHLYIKIQNILYYWVKMTICKIECKFGFKMSSMGDPWVAQQFSACLWPRAQSWGPGIGSRVGVPAWSLLLPVSASLSLYLSWISK